MADLSRLAQLLNGIVRGVEISDYALIVDNLKIKMGSGNNANHATFSGTLTAPRTITMPDAPVDLGDIALNTSDRHSAATLNADDPTQQTLNLSGQELQVNLATGATDGAMSAEDKTKLDGVETAATADQTGAEIKVAYEAELDTNAYTDAEKTKLAGIEAAATADQTGAEIKVAYEAELDTNAFDDAAVTKLGGIEALADVTDATNVDAAGATMNTDTDVSANDWVVDEDTMSSDLATKVPTQQSVKAYVDTEVASAIAGGVTFKGNYDAATNAPDLDTTPIATLQGDMYVISAAGTFFGVEVEIGDQLIAKQDTATAEAHWSIVQANLTPSSIKTQYESNANTNAFTDAEQTKLTGIETAATADQTDAEIKTAYENNADTNAFTDAEQTKLSGIEAGAKDDQSAAEVPFTATGSVAATDVQAAIAEVSGDADAAATAASTAQTTADDHISDATDAHAATAIGYTPATAGDWDVAPSEAESALDEAASRIRTLETDAAEIESLSEKLDAGETLAAGIKALRWGKNAETAGRTYLADNDATSADNFHVMGLVVATGETAGTEITVTKDGKFVAAAHGFTVGEPIYLGAGGVLTSTAPSTSNLAVVKVGMARTTGLIEIQVQILGVN